MIRVLIADDSPPVRQMLVEVLNADADLSVVGEADSGRTAVEQTEVLEPDVVTMDVVMPDMDGLEATRRIMASRPTPVLVVSAYADAPEMNVAFEALASGAADLMPKFDPAKDASVLEWGRELAAKVKAVAASPLRSVA